MGIQDSQARIGRSEVVGIKKVQSCEAKQCKNWEDMITGLPSKYRPVSQNSYKIKKVNWLKVAVTNTTAGL